MSAFINFFMVCVLVHALPVDVLVALGQLSDVVSDLSPEFVRGIEHIAFTLLLN